MKRGRSAPLAAPLLVALGLRLLCVAFRNQGFPPGWGGEMASVAAALARGEGFASPYFTPTGPTALVPPLYPLLLSGLFRVFGVHEPLAGGVALVVNAVLSTAVCLPVNALGRRLAGPRVGHLATWLWALQPLAGFSDAIFLWSASLQTLLLTALVTCTVALRPEDRAARFLGYGALAGLAALTEPVSLAAFAPFLLWLGLRRGVAVPRLLLSVLVALALIMPWLARNQRVFGEWVFLRSGLGLELSRGIGAGFGAGARLGPVPGRDAGELRRYRELGEVDYMREKLRSSLGWIRRHPGEFASRCLDRVVAFWAGDPHVSWLFWGSGRWVAAKHLLYLLPALLALAALLLLARRGVRDAEVFWLLFALYPTIYYLTHTQTRVRFPLEPSLFALSAVALDAARARLRPRAGTARGRADPRSPAREHSGSAP